LQARDHFSALDGLRGVAAICVLFFHLGNWQQQPWIAPSAWIATDFFFVLSGYVLSIAYRAKLDHGMSTRTFMTIRLIRLMPIIMIGTLISAAFLTLRLLILDDPIDLRELGIATLLGTFVLPMFNASSPIGGPQIFPLNGPEYTLFLELVVNAFWVAARKLDGIWFALAITVIGYSLTAVYDPGGDTASNFWQGFPRVFGAYYLGVLIYYVQLQLPVATMQRLAVWFWPLLLATFVMFFWPHRVSHWTAWGWSLIFPPLLVLTGSHVQLSGARRRVALLLGALSYPIYALHYPIFVWVNGAYQQILHRKDYIIGSSLVIPSVLIGTWLILKVLDEPARKMLTAWTRRAAARSRETAAAQQSAS
jgi:peptidoglycan/LPS O-acetylase OafA/YrhL